MPINEVRNTVLAIANKNNYGYISPQDFNLYASQAQMDMFEDYFYQYNNQLVKENQRTSGTGYADITKGLAEVIDTFYVDTPLLNSATTQSGDIQTNLYTLPADYYLINKMMVYTKELASGVTTSTNGGATAVNDTTADFIAAGVAPGDIVSTITNGVVYNTVISQVVSATNILVFSTVGVTVWDLVGKTYNIYSANDVMDAERVSQAKITMLNNSILTKPTLGYPAYTQDALVAQAFPITINKIGQLTSQYVRYPFTPNWTYATLLAGEPLFDPTAADYQDFELPLSDEPALIAKICQYVGIEIREADVYNFGTQELQQEQITQG
ncbi:MAG: hypothetical protein CMJ25_14795 [Phycisphaerae bacterium]|nr:hypothetical protein [Phycisphaerae bacterium]|tara:strand:+ start:82 stop:1059 length:978 start_codon:yes stop_codon:yes gene_type:complete